MMAFEPDVIATPQTIADISIQLTDMADGKKTAAYSVQVAMSDGTIKVRTGDLLPHITTAQRNALQNSMASLRTQATTEML